MTVFSKIRFFWRRIASSRKVRALESEIAQQRAEIERLRAENRALLNSILGIAGIPPIPVPIFTPNPVTTFTSLSPADGHSESPTHSRGGDESPVRPTSSSLPTKADRGDSSSRKSETRNDSPSPSAARTAILFAAQKQSHAAPTSNLSPVRRRRSWHQINRMLEIESARKPKDQGRGEGTGA
jgi:hypothetical protein